MDQMFTVHGVHVFKVFTRPSRGAVLISILSGSDFFCNSLSAVMILEFHVISQPRDDSDRMKYKSSRDSFLHVIV